MAFERRINYYETDRMGIVHHSNYIRFLEEARIQYMDEIGLPYHSIENAGLAIPVLGVNLNYKTPAKFDDIILIDMQITEFNGVRMTIQYTIYNKETGNLVATGNTKHCFTGNGLKPISLKKEQPSMYEIFQMHTTKE